MDKFAGSASRFRRKEDIRLLTGGGTLPTISTGPNQAHAFVLRSPHAHARILSIDTARRRRRRAWWRC